ncbi:phage/plasmid primase, P4 family [Mycobacterium sp. SMC-17]|uniref:phage/plasmid primase, P4 family n=1 Tax=Mycobacterium sp. SMC-17 TaxID=3381628 RepID=UPI0038773BF0
MSVPADSDNTGSEHAAKFATKRRKLGAPLILVTDETTREIGCNGLAHDGPIPDDSWTESDELPRLTIPDVNGMEPLPAALAYADAGWYVVPVAVKSKNPGSIVGKWAELSSRNPDQIRQWWAKHPDAGIAAHVGKSGAVVFDLDQSSADGIPASLWGGLQTGMVQRSRLGESVRGHYVFACEPNAYSNAAGGFMRYGEVRGRNGVIIVAPSVHEKADEGGFYRWETVGEVPELPGVLRDLLTKSLPGDEYADPKSVDELREFLAAHTADNRGYALKGQLTAFTTDTAAGASRHESACKALVWAFREAIAECYPAQSAYNELRAAFEAVKPESVSNGEFDRMACWAAAQAELADPGETRRRLDRNVWPAPETPLLVAERIAELAEAGGSPVKRWRGGWYPWDGSSWPEITEEALRGDLYQLLAKVQYVKRVQGVPTLMPWNPDKGKLDKAIDALKGVVSLANEVDAPCWLDGRAVQVIACRNGLVKIAGRELIDCTPTYFNTSALPFDYDTNAPKPVRWLGFLASVWPDDAEAVALLQEWFGYVLSGRTDMQKLLAIIGPTRSGKGTIDKVLAALVGKANYIGASSKSLQGEFGLEPMVGKSLAVFSDDRVTVNGKAFVETILKITGEDEVTVGQKYRQAWTGRLPTRLMLMSNEIPTLPDNSRAVAARMLWLRMTKSFAGHEDTTLAKALLGELPSILLWALEGLDRLNLHGRFTHAASGDVLGEFLADIAAPIVRFADEMCTVSADDLPDPSLFASGIELFAAYSTWCERHGHNPGSDVAMGKALFAAFNGKVRKYRPRINGKPTWGYQGIALIPKHSRIVASGPVR